MATREGNDLIRKDLAEYRSAKGRKPGLHRLWHRPKESGGWQQCQPPLAFALEATFPTPPPAVPCSVKAIEPRASLRAFGWPIVGQPVIIFDRWYAARQSNPGKLAARKDVDVRAEPRRRVQSYHSTKLISGSAPGQWLYNATWHVEQRKMICALPIVPFTRRASDLRKVAKGG
jgi:hypothetical protein